MTKLDPVWPTMKIAHALIACRDMVRPEEALVHSAQPLPTVLNMMKTVIVLPVTWDMKRMVEESAVVKQKKDVHHTVILVLA